jgi:hypothetical protein
MEIEFQSVHCPKCQDNEHYVQPLVDGSKFGSPVLSKGNAINGVDLRPLAVARILKTIDPSSLPPKIEIYWGHDRSKITAEQLTYFQHSTQYQLRVMRADLGLISKLHIVNVS